MSAQSKRFSTPDPTTELCANAAIKLPARCSVPFQFGTRPSRPTPTLGLIPKKVPVRLGMTALNARALKCQLAVSGELLMPFCVLRTTVGIAGSHGLPAKSGGPHETISFVRDVVHIRRSRVQRVTGNCWCDDQQQTGRRSRVLHVCRLSARLRRKGRRRAPPTPGRARCGSHRYRGLCGQPERRRQSRWRSPLEPFRAGLSHCVKSQWLWPPRAPGLTRDDLPGRDPALAFESEGEAPRDFKTPARCNDPRPSPAPFRPETVRARVPRRFPH